MNNQNQYEYCPRCKALLSNGVCGCCGYPTDLNNTTNMNPYVNPVYQEPKKQLSNGAIVGIVLGVLGGFVLLVFILVLVIFLIAGGLFAAIVSEMDEKSVIYQYDEESDYENYLEDKDLDDVINSELEENDGDIDDSEESDWLDYVYDLDGDGLGDLIYEPGLEALNDEYYRTINDYLRYDLSYHLSFEIYEEASEGNSAYYPIVSDYNGGNRGVDFYKEINTILYSKCKVSVNGGEDYYTTTVPYVTYMDESVLSVIYIVDYHYNDGRYGEKVFCYNFDMTTGKLKRPTVEFNEDFMSELMVRCMEQSTLDSGYLFTAYTKDELADIMENNADAFIAFYTPLGMEFGIQYEGYWCCSTFKDYDKYVSFEEIKIEEENISIAF